MDDERATRLVWVGLGAMVPIFLAGALVGIRDQISNADVALMLVVVVVVAAVGGGRDAGAAAAVSSAVSFDFFHTRPYLELRIATREDVVTTVLLLVVGLVVGTVAAGARRARSSAETSRGEVRRIYRVAELAAAGDDAPDVILHAQIELTELLHLRDCRFEAAPFGAPLARLERSGTVSSHRYRLRDEGLELPPEGVELQVLGRGQLLGRFVLDPVPGTGVSLEARVVAVALADQVGAVLAAPQPGDKEHRHG